MRDSTGPAYPLSREEFRRAITTGHGRVKLHVERFGAAEVREAILAAATISGTDYAGDLVGERSAWLAELCLAAGVVEEVISKQAEYTGWERSQRCGLLLEFSKRGHPSARAALYAECGRDPHYGTRYGCEEIIDLDGEEGLLFVARKLATILAESNDGFCVHEDDLEPYDRKYGAGSGRALLERAAATDQLVRAFLDGIAATEARRRAREAEPRPHGVRRPERSVDDVLKEIADSEEPLYGLHGWGRRNADREDLGRVLTAALASDRVCVIANCLRVLGGSGLPPLHPAIFEWTRHPDADVRERAASVLGQHSLPAVRELGLAALARGELVCGISMLENSAQAQDGDTIARALRPLADLHEEYVLSWSVLDLLQHCPEVRDPRIPMHAYEHAPHVECRAKALGFLVRWRAVPAWLAEECAQDASEDVRALASRALTAMASSETGT